MIATTTLAQGGAGLGMRRATGTEALFGTSGPDVT